MYDNTTASKAISYNPYNIFDIWQRPLRQTFSKILRNYRHEYELKDLFFAVCGLKQLVFSSCNVKECLFILGEISRLGWRVFIGSFLYLNDYPMSQELQNK